MYSARGGVRHHSSWIRFTSVAILLTVVGTFAIGVHSNLTLSVGASNSKANAAPVAEKVQSPKKLEAPAAAQLYPEGSDTPDKVTQAVNTAIGREQGATWSVAVYDVANNQWLAQVNAEQKMTSASLYKLYAAYALSKVIPPSEWASKTVAGQSLTSCVDRMLRLSDNTCGDAVGEMVGWGAIDRADRAYGFSETNVNVASGPTTTAKDTTTFMSDLYQTKLFDVSTTGFILDSLHHQLYRKGIPTGCSDCTVYNKTGNDGTVSHDTAVVSSGNSTYAVTIMSQHGSSAGIARIEQAIQAALQSN